jgi:hypothetical protein
VISSPSLRGRLGSSILAFALASALPPTDAGAANAKIEAEAKRLQTKAMDTDFLGLNYKAARGKLETALKRCGKSGCGLSLIASLRRDLGIVKVHAGDPAAGEKELVEALAADPKIEINKDFLAHPGVKKAWEGARAKLGLGEPTPETPPAKDPPKAEVEGGITIKITSAPLGVELPIVFTLPPGLEVASLKVSYKTDTMEKYRTVDAKRGDGGKKKGPWWVLLPCDATSAQGSLKLYAKALDSSGVEVDRFGSIKQPAKIDVVAELPEDAVAPTIPGGGEPRACDEAEDGKPEGAGCREDDECAGSLACVENEDGVRWCQPGERAKRSDAPRLWFGLDGEIDVVLLGADRDLCKQDSWACSADTPRGRRDVGVADSRGINVPTGGGGRTDGGSSVGTKVVALTVDYFLTPRLSLGARVGFAFPGNPTTSAPFLPIHAEARGRFFFLDGPVRPYAMLSLGYGRFDPPVRGVIVEPNDPANANGCSRGGDVPTCIPENDSRPVLTGVTAYKLTGPFFVGAAFGAWVPLGRRFALDGAFRLYAPLPNFAFAIAPNVGLRFAF